MNESALAQFRLAIKARLADIAEEDALGADSQSVVRLDQQAIGRLSRQDALQMQAMAKAQAGRRGLEKRRLEDALTRISDGEYGFCEDCGDAIPEGRLRLNLAATRCVSCASG